MPEWVVGVPAWGEDYIANAHRIALPSIVEALARAKQKSRIVVYTDSPDRFDCFNIECRPVPQAEADTDFNKYCAAHRDLLDKGRPGQFISPLCADVAVSLDFFTTCEKAFAAGKKVVATCGPRTYAETLPPIGADAQTLMDWALDHLHPINREGFWGKGRTGTPSLLFFCDGTGIVNHSFHLSPIAFVFDGRDLGQLTSTDGSLVQSYKEEEFFIGGPQDGLTIIECSPIEKSFPLLDDAIGIESVARWARDNATARHRFFFKHPILLKGRDRGMTRMAANAILAAI